MSQNIKKITVIDEQQPQVLITRNIGVDAENVDYDANTNLAQKLSSVDINIDGKMDKVNPIGTGKFSMNGTAEGELSFAEGDNTRAIGKGSHAEGEGTKAEGIYSHAEGGGCWAYREYTHAEGCNDGDQPTIASCKGAHAEGMGTISSGNGSHSEGKGSQALREASHSEGRYTKVEGDCGHAEGENSTVADGALCGHAEGLDCHANGRFTHAEGQKSTANGDASHVEGYGNTTGTRAACAHAEGDENQANGYTSHVEGKKNIANGDYQHVQGKYNVADNENKYAHIVGGGTTDSNDNPIRKNIHTLDWEGNAEYAGDVIAHGCNGGSPVSLLQLAGATIGNADWEQNDENGFGYIKNRPFYEYEDNGEVLFDDNIVIPTHNGADYYYFPTPLNIIDGNEYLIQFDDIEPFRIVAGDSFNLSGDELKQQIASNVHLFNDRIYFYYYVKNEFHVKISSIGTGNIIVKQLDEKFISYKPGLKVENGGEIFNDYASNRATGDYSHAEGGSCQATGDYSHAEGMGTIAFGDYSHAEGENTYANGNYSHTEGYRTQASSDYQHVQGKYNVIDHENKYAHIVGGGSSATDEARKNIHTLDWKGNAEFAGYGRFGGNVRCHYVGADKETTNQIISLSKLVRVLVDKKVITSIDDVCVSGDDE